MNSFVLESINLHILRLSEHQMEEQDLQNITVTGYSLGHSYRQRNLQEEEECVLLLERVKALTKLILRFIMQIRLWKFVQLNLKLNLLT